MWGGLTIQPTGSPTTKPKGRRINPDETTEELSISQRKGGILVENLFFAIAANMALYYLDQSSITCAASPLDGRI